MSAPATCAARSEAEYRLYASAQQRLMHDALTCPATDIVGKQWQIGSSVFEYRDINGESVLVKV